MTDFNAETGGFRREALNKLLEMRRAFAVLVKCFARVLLGEQPKFSLMSFRYAHAHTSMRPQPRGSTKRDNAAATLPNVRKSIGSTLRSVPKYCLTNRIPLRPSLKHRRTLDDVALHDTSLARKVVHHN